MQNTSPVQNPSPVQDTAAATGTPPGSPWILLDLPRSRPRHKLARLFCNLARVLRRLAHALPWDKLSSGDRRRVEKALKLLERDLLLVRAVVGGESESIEVRSRPKGPEGRWRPEEEESMEEEREEGTEDVEEEVEDEWEEVKGDQGIIRKEDHEV